MGIILVVSLSGCTSIRSTFVERGADGQFSGDRLATRARGVPIKLKVPTHVEVNIEEVYYIDVANGHVIYPKQRILEVSKPEMVYEYQMFTVDIVRPFSGTLDANGSGNGYLLDENQQLTSLGASVTDNTISSISNILKGDAGKLLGPKKTSVGEGGKGLDRKTRVVSTKRFDITLPNWHIEMNDWINGHMQNCSSQCPTTCGCNNCREGWPLKDTLQFESIGPVQVAPLTH